MVPRRRVSAPPSPRPPWYRFRHRSCNCRRSFEVSRKISHSPQSSSPPPHTDENDGGDAEDNDGDVLLACWYSVPSAGLKISESTWQNPLQCGPRHVAFVVTRNRAHPVHFTCESLCEAGTMCFWRGGGRSLEDVFVVLFSPDAFLGVRFLSANGHS